MFSTDAVQYFHGFVVDCGCVNRASINIPYIDIGKSSCCFSIHKNITGNSL